MAHKKYFLNNEQNEETYNITNYNIYIIPYYQEITHDKSDRKCIVVHLTSSYKAYNKRYTEEFRYY